MEHSISTSPINMVVRLTKLDTKETAWAGTGEKGASEWGKRAWNRGSCKKAKGFGMS